MTKPKLHGLAAPAPYLRSESSFNNLIKVERGGGGAKSACLSCTRRVWQIVCIRTGTIAMFLFVTNFSSDQDVPTLGSGTDDRPVSLNRSSPPPADRQTDNYPWMRRSWFLDYGRQYPGAPRVPTRHSSPFLHF